jgi:hypothetical protein
MLTFMVLIVMSVLAPSAVAAPSSAVRSPNAAPLIDHRAALTPTMIITPLLVNSQQARDTIVTQTLVLSNVGTGELVWHIHESSGSALSAGLPSAPQALEVIQDGSFEMGHPNPYWAEYSLNFSQILYFGGSAHTGSWWAWFGGAGYTQAEEGYISQTVTITPGLAHLSFWIKLNAAGTGNFTVTLDNTNVFTANQAMTATYANYTLITRDVTAFADGQPHVLKLAESDPATPGGFDVYIDDVSLTVLDCVPSDLPWLTVSPGSGATPAAASSTINLIFNSTGRAGTFTGNLCVTSNDPEAELIKVPLTLKVLTVFLPLILR